MPSEAGSTQFNNSLFKRLTGIVTKVSDAFAFPLRTSHYIELVNPLWSTHALQARVEAVWDETSDSRTITLRPGLNWRSHRPGQHLRIGVPIGGQHFTRTYSISSAPERNDGCFTITVKAIDNGRMSHHLVRKLKVGDYVPIGVPQGDFYLPDAQPVLPLFITAGSGITPIMSMLRSLVLQERMPNTMHIHYAPHTYDVIFGRELKLTAEKQKLYKLHLVHTREPGQKLEEMTGKRPHFSKEQLEQLCPDWRKRDVYACGPQAMLDSIEQLYEAEGLSRQVHTERFRAQLAGVPTEVKTGVVKFLNSNVSANSDGETNLLRLAEDSGLNPEHGCRMGICHGCDVKLASGCVRDLRTNALINETGQVIQICVCTAVGDAEIEV
ncbi:MAG: ferredoxin reductase [Limnobacter sp.]|uniref:ferredoxin reductase n=1 Tax=Limnobacter sp. TaxID=2003368 RepID=UPI00273418A8|nr:ferredoxin reductase [Limnobacter sp.]MDP3189258.1 ferredoxin reductase [Limnobacter sp.]